jgi:hypothetical protein
MDPDSLSLCFQDPTTGPFYEQILSKAVFHFSHLWDIQIIFLLYLHSIGT